MSYQVDLGALERRARANIILENARGDLSGRLWRAALGATRGGAPSEELGKSASSASLAVNPLLSLGEAPIMPAGLTALLAVLSPYEGGSTRPTGRSASFVPRPPTSTKPGAVAPSTSVRGTDQSGYATSGANAAFSSVINAAGARTGIPSSAITAIINAEAARNPDGSWNPLSRNPRSSAAGLGQFLSGTWLSIARQPGTWLNELARQRGLIDETGHIASDTRSKLLALRYDPAVAIETVADYALANLKRLEHAGVGIGGEAIAIARAAYLAHHLGPGDALRFYHGSLGATRAARLLAAQIGAGAATKRIAEAGDAALAHRAWLTRYISRHVKAEPESQARGDAALATRDVDI